MPLSNRAQVAIRIRQVLPHVKCHSYPEHDDVSYITVEETVPHLWFFTRTRRRTLASWRSRWAPNVGHVDFWDCRDRDTYEKLASAGFYCEYTPPEEELASMAFDATAEEYDRQ